IRLPRMSPVRHWFRGKPCVMDSVSRDRNSCPMGLDFCMNDVYHDCLGGFVVIYKRCVSEDEYQEKWFNRSSDNSECTGYDPSNTLSGQLRRHFCCTKDGCNKATRPQDVTLWTPFYRG
ncbi:hypothetical protein PoB_004614900, partial [Plakobranchus ocellatus]